MVSLDILTPCWSIFQTAPAWLGAHQLEGGSLQERGGTGTAPLLLLPLPNLSLISTTPSPASAAHTGLWHFMRHKRERGPVICLLFKQISHWHLQPLNSTACCKWNCLLCSVRAGYSQLSLLTQLHKISPSCHPTLQQHSLGPALFPLKCWGKKWSQDCSTIFFFWIWALLKNCERVWEMKTEGQALCWCKRVLIYTALAARDNLSPGSDFPLAHPSENQQIKTKV